MSSPSPRRRRADRKPPRATLIAPTPPATTETDSQEVVSSIDLALEAARRARRHMTLMSVAMVPGARNAADLAEMSDVVRRTIRAGDGMWRDGADGLAILLTDVDGAASEPVLARMRLRVKGGPGRVRIGRATAAPGIAAADLLELAHFDRDRHTAERRSKE